MAHTHLAAGLPGQDCPNMNMNMNMTRRPGRRGSVPHAAETADTSHTREVSEIFNTHSSPQGSPTNNNNEHLAQDDSGQSSAQSAAEGAQTGRKRRLCTLDTQYEGHYDEVKRRCRQSSTATEAEAQGPHRFQRVDIARTGRRTMERLEDLARGDG